MAYFYLIVAFSLNAAANVLLKLGAEQGVHFLGLTTETLTRNWLTILGILLFAVNIVFYFLALRALPLSIAYPIMIGMSFLLASCAAFYFLHESIGWQHVIGYALILAGVTLIAGYGR